MQQIISKPIEDLIEYDRNPRRNDHAVDKVAAAIKEYGFRVPILAKSDGLIIDGHLRLKAAKKLKLKEVPVILCDDMTDAQVKAFRISINRMADLAEWDSDLLRLELDELEELDVSMELAGFDEDSLGEIFKEEEESQPAEVIKAEEDDYEEPEAMRVDVVKGDLITFEKGGIELHRLLCGDSTVVEDVEKVMNGQNADLYLSDPPYGVCYSDKNEFLNRLDKYNRCVQPIENDHKTPSEMYDFWLSVFSLACGALKNTGSYYLFAPQGGDLLLLLQAVRDSGFQLKHILIWAKNNHVLGRCDYNYQHEPIVFGWKQKGTHIFYGEGGNLTSLWNYNKPLCNDLHPTMKPIDLLQNPILNSSKVDDVVLDNFSGSGSTMVAAHQLGRRCYGIEISERYCQVIIDRMQKFDTDLVIKINGESYGGNNDN